MILKKSIFFGPRIESWKKVRKLHAAANAKSLKVNGPNGFMTQFDMVTTQWAFVGPAIILPEKLGFGTPSGLALNCLMPFRKNYNK